MTFFLASARVDPPPGHLSRRTAIALGLLAGLLGSACSPSTGSTERRTVTVFAASSLTKAFTEVGAAFEEAHPGVQVRFSFAGSQTLVAQLQQGAPAGVLATADLTTFERVRELTGEPVVFAHNRLALITTPGNPLRLGSLTDLSRRGLKVVLATPSVPVGAASAAALAAAGVTVVPVSFEDSVAGVVTKVRLGEADAGIAYATDLLGGELGGLALPESSTSLAIAAVLPVQPEAQRFVAFVRSTAGQDVLSRYGFR